MNRGFQRGGFRGGAGGGGDRGRGKYSSSHFFNKFCFIIIIQAEEVVEAVEDSVDHSIRVPQIQC